MLNKVFLIGNLTRDPEFRMIPGSDTPTTTFTIAIDRPFSNRQTGKPEVDYINIVTYRRTAELCRDSLRQGSKVCVEGRLQIRKYQTTDGQNRTATEVVADSIEFLTPKSQGNGNQMSQNQNGYGGYNNGSYDNTPFSNNGYNGGYNNGGYNNNYGNNGNMGGYGQNNNQPMGQGNQTIERNEEDDSYPNVSFSRDDLL